MNTPDPAPGRTAGQLATVAGLYVVQALVAGFGVLVMLPGFAQAGVDLEKVAPVLVAGAVPWVVKLAWAGLIDGATRARPRRLKVFIAGGQAAAGVAMWMVAGSFGAVLRGEQLPTMLATWWFVTNAALALQDAGTDALTLDAVDPRDRGKAGLAMQVGHGLGQGVLVAGLFFHLMIGVAVPWSLPALSRLAAGLVFASAWLGLAFPGVPAARPPRPIGPALAELAREPRVYLAVAAAVLAGLPDAMTGVVSAEFLTAELQWDALKLIRVLRVGAFVGVAITLALLPLADRIGRRALAVAGAALIGVAYVAFGLSPGLWSRDLVFYAVGASEAIGRGLLLAGLWAILMDLTHPAFRAVQFTLWVSLINLGRVVAPAMVVPLVQGQGYATLWILAGALSLLTIPLLWVIGGAGSALFTRTSGDSQATPSSVDKGAATP